MICWTLGTGYLNIEPGSYRWTIRIDGKDVLMSCATYPSEEEAWRVGIEAVNKSGLLMDVVEPKKNKRRSKPGKAGKERKQ